MCSGAVYKNENFEVTVLQYYNTRGSTLHTRTDLFIFMMNVAVITLNTQAFVLFVDKSWIFTSAQFLNCDFQIVIK